MEGKKNIGILYIIVGLLVLVLSLIFDLLGAGIPGFGKYQIIGVIVGVIVTGVGFWLKAKK